MIRQRKPIRRSRIQLKERKGIVGGEYIFEYDGKVYVLNGRFIQDGQSPDGLRWVATRESNRVIRWLVCEIAQRQCEMKLSPICWKWAPVDKGHPHHVRHKKMGGAFTDDRIWLKGKRIRIWACPNCHQEHHGPLAWSRGRGEQAGCHVQVTQTIAKVGS